MLVPETPQSAETTSASKADSQNTAKPPVFDPSQGESSAKKYLYDPTDIVRDYVEKHFRQPLSDTAVKEMLIRDPRPDVPACQVPTVDDAVSSWLGDKFPKSADSNMYKLQQSLLSVSGPLVQLWEDIIANADATEVPRDVVLETLQRTLVLLGHVNAKFSAHRRSVILEAAANKQLVQSARALPLPKEGSSLFGDDFFKVLEKKGEDRKTLSKATSAWSYRRERQSGSTRKSEGFVAYCMNFIKYTFTIIILVHNISFPFHSYNCLLAVAIQYHTP